FAAHVPHYLAQNEYPAAAEALVTAISRATGLSLGTEQLQEAAELLRLSVDAQVAKADEVAAHVRDHDAQYDAVKQALRGPAGLSLGTEQLQEAAELLRLSVDAQVAKADEVAAHVRNLEEQYDAVMQSRRGSSLLSDLSSLPTADELGAELERFLAQQQGPGDP